MATLLSNVTNSIWHAFSALMNDKSGNVMKSKLKVCRYIYFSKEYNKIKRFPSINQSRWFVFCIVISYIEQGYY